MITSRTTLIDTSLNLLNFSKLFYSFVLLIYICILTILVIVIFPYSLFLSTTNFALIRQSSRNNDRMYFSPRSDQDGSRNSAFQAPTTQLRSLPSLTLLYARGGTDEREEGFYCVEKELRSKRCGRGGRGQDLGSPFLSF